MGQAPFVTGHVEAWISGLGISCMPLSPAHSICPFSGPLPRTGSEPHDCSWTLTKAVCTVPGILSPLPASPPYSSHQHWEHGGYGVCGQPAVRSLGTGHYFSSPLLCGSPPPHATPHKSISWHCTSHDLPVTNLTPPILRFRRTAENVDNAGNVNQPRLTPEYLLFPSNPPYARTCKKAGLSVHAI